MNKVLSWLVLSRLRLVRRLTQSTKPDSVTSTTIPKAFSSRLFLNTVALSPAAKTTLEDHYKTVLLWLMLCQFIGLIFDTIWKSANNARDLKPNAQSYRDLSPWVNIKHQLFSLIKITSKTSISSSITVPWMLRPAKTDNLSHTQKCSVRWLAWRLSVN